MTDKMQKDTALPRHMPSKRPTGSRKSCRIHLIQLPLYCPHLNPIARLWAIMHKRVTHNRHYPTQKHFANAILNFMRKVVPKPWLNFRDRVTDNFRIISHQNVRVLE
jgi:transposase